MLKRTLFSVLALLMSIPLWAFEVDGIEYNKLTDSTCKVTARSAKYSGAIEIPSSVQYSGITYTVVSIGNSAFSKCTSLTEVTIPNSVTSIGNYAFSGCTGLTEVIVPNSVTSIGNYAFYECSGLTEVTIGNSVTSIGADAFSFCNLKKMAYPAGLNIVGDYTVKVSYDPTDCIIEDGLIYNAARTKLIYVSIKKEGEFYISDTVTSIGRNAFACCSDLTEVIIPNSVTSIGDCAFSKCTGLTEVTIGNSVTSIGWQAFYKSTGLREVTIPNSVTSIEGWAFYGCTGLTEVTIGNSVTSIGDLAFEHCDGLKEVVILSSAISIESYAFSRGSLKKVAIPHTVDYSFGDAKRIYFDPSDYCFEDGVIFNANKTQILYVSLLKEGEFTIPETVKAIGENAFVCCDKLSIINALPTTAPDNYENSFSDLYSDVTLNVSAESLFSYLYSGYWHLFENIIADGKNCKTTDDVFTYGIDFRTSEAVVIDVADRKMTNATIPSRMVVGDGDAASFYQVTGIGCNAFQGMTYLKSVKFPACLTTISGQAFKGCTAIESIELPDNTGIVGPSAFEGCRSLGKVTFPDRQIAIGDRAFYGCTNLPSVGTVNASTIGAYAFGGCSSLSSVGTVNASTLGAYAFGGANRLRAICVNADTIGVHCFDGCNSISSADLKCKVIEDYAFYGCSALESLNYTDVNVIGEGAFSRTRMGKVVIAESVNRIGDKAFESCPWLKTFYIDNGDYLELGENVLESSPVESITIGRDCSDWGSFNINTLETLSIQDTVTEMPDAALKGCNSLKNLDLGSGLDRIPMEAFDGCINLGSVKFPENVSEIGDRAFNGCNTLVEVKFPIKRIKIGKSAFSGCSRLKELNFINADSICEKAFYNCYSLIQVNTSAEIIEEMAFCGCTSLADFDFSSVKSIGNHALSSTGLTEVSIPHNVQSIGDSAFADCSGLRKFRVNDSPNPIDVGQEILGGTPVTTLHLGRNCNDWRSFKSSNLKNLSIGNLVTNIPEGAFQDCASLERLALGSSVQTIGAAAFKGCYRLTEAVIPSSVASIGANAFDGCKNIGKIAIGSGIKEIGELAFNEVNSATSVCVAAVVPPAASNNSFSNYSVTLCVPAESIAAYYNFTKCWYRFEPQALIPIEKIDVTAPADIASIQPGDKIQLTATITPENASLPYIFWQSDNIGQATVDNNGLVTVHAVDANEPVIDISALSLYDNMSGQCSITPDVKVFEVDGIMYAKSDNENCEVRRLTTGKYTGKIVVPETVTYKDVTYTVTSFGDAFSGCDGLTSVTIPNTVSHIPDKTFEGCIGLKEVTIADGMSGIKFGDRAFDDSKLESLYLGREFYTESGWFNIGPFSCRPLKKLVVGTNVACINEYQFYSCSDLELIEFIDGGILQDIFYNAFYGCEKLTSIVLPNSVKTIGEGAFGACRRLASVTLSSSLEYIYAYAFNGCETLTSIDMPESLLSIGEGAFGYCTALAVVNLSGHIKEIGAEAFSGCRALTSIDIPATVTEIQDGTFADCTSLSNVNLPNTITKIGNNAFYYCCDLKSAALPSVLETIGDNAFFGCALPEIVIPRYVQQIGDEAFSNCRSSKKTAIGCGVWQIGRGAFNACYGDLYLASAQPPLIGEFAFGSYALIYVQDTSLYNILKDENSNWSNYFFTKFTGVNDVSVTVNSDVLNLEPGQTIQLAAKVTPENTDLPYVFWRSTNPEQATVDHNGLVTIHAVSDDEPATIIAESLCAYAPAASIALTVEALGIEDIAADTMETCCPNDIYTLQGVCIKRDATQADIDALAPGLYIIAGQKVLIRW